MSNSNAVVITGANRGIGLALTSACVKRGDNVVAVCRQSAEELNSLGVRVISDIDVAKAKDIARLVDEIGELRIDCLINNAGILRSSSLETPAYSDILAQFEVNSVAPLRVTLALLEKFRSGSKIAMITSRMGSVADNSSGGSYGYRMSKSALNAAGKSLALDLKPRGISVALLHPGYVQTEMVNWGGEISPEFSANRLLKRIDELTLLNSGSFWHSSGEELPW